MSGYCFANAEEAFLTAEEIPGESSRVLKEACRDYKISAVVGLLERSQDQIYNSALLITPEGITGIYRKTHLICLGVDRFASCGNDLPVFETPLGKLGMLICYDQRFPEPARVLALQQAQVILNPVNLPTGAEAYPNFFFQSRACENRIFIVAANRVGVENGVRFIGRSQIINCFGQVLAEGDSVTESLITAEIDPQLADQKRVVNRPGEYEFDIVADRRADLYKIIAR